MIDPALHSSATPSLTLSRIVIVVLGSGPAVVRIGCVVTKSTTAVNSHSIHPSHCSSESLTTAAVMEL